MINFPSSPTVGQVFTSGMAKYVWDGAAWHASKLETALPFNYIVNPHMLISQQNGRTGSTLNGYVPADQWTAYFTGALATSTASEPSIPFHIRLWSNALVGSVPASEYAMLSQYIEGNRFAPFMWGIAGVAKPAVLRFKARITNGPVPYTFAVALRQYSVSHSFIKHCTLTSVNQFQEFIVPIPVPPVGTWAITSAGALSVSFVGTNGTTFTTPTENAWVTGNYLSSTGIGNLHIVASRGFDIADVGLYMDPANTGRPPPAESVSFSRAELDSLRYWTSHTKMRGVSSTTTAFSRAGNQNTVPMRGTPATALVGAVNAFDTFANSPITGIGAAPYSSVHNYEVELTCGGTLSPGKACIMLTNGGYIAANARM